MVFFYAYPHLNDNSIIVSSYPIKLGESYEIKTVRNPEHSSENLVPEYTNYLNGNKINFGLVSFEDGNVRELGLKMGDEISELYFTNNPVNWDSYISKMKRLTQKEAYIKSFFKSFYWVG